MAIGKVLVATWPEGFSEFATKALSDVEFRHPALFLADKEGYPICHAFFYATRLDWLRFAIKIGEHFSSSSCISEYLKSALSGSVKINASSFFSRLSQNKEYGRHFWLQNHNLSFNNMEMRGRFGKLAAIDLDKGRVLVIHSIDDDYDYKKIYQAIFTPWASLKCTRA